MTVITDPLFYVVAIPAVMFLGLSKGGFSSVGMVATPLVAVVMGPLEAAALLLPIILIQDAVSVWVYRRTWDPWNLKVMIPGCVIGVGAAWLLAAHVSDGVIRLVVGLIALGLVSYTFFRHWLPGETAPPLARRVLGRDVGLHHHADPDRRPALLRVRAAAAAAEAGLCRHHGDVL